jgi:hypothetical protein
MRSIRFGWLVAVVFLYGLWHVWSERAISHPPGVLAPADPVQTNVRGTPPTFIKAGYTITPLASFDANARVILAEHYHWDTGADLSPVDLALGWGRMSDSAVLKGLSFSQGNRFYYYRWTGEPPIPPNEIITHSANMHMIPANDAIAKRLSRIHAGNLVHFSGYLIKAEKSGGWTWISSLTRDDTGAGACEVVWVEQLEVR